MAFAAALRTTGDEVVLQLEGDLDSTTAPAFRVKVEEATASTTGRLVLDMTRLDYLSSAGLRVLVFARQTMGADTGLVLVGTNAAVTETIRLTGFDQSVTFSDHVPQ